MMKQIKDFEWSSLLDLTGKGLHQFNSVDKDMNCSQLMRNAELDWKVDLKPVQFTDNNGSLQASDKLLSLVKDDKEVMVSGLTDSYHPMQNESIAKLGDYFAEVDILGRDEAPPKPEPDGIHQLLSQWGAESSDAIMVGDYLFDLQSGRKAGTATIHVDTSEQYLWPEWTDLAIRDLVKLYEMMRCCADSN